MTTDIEYQPSAGIIDQALAERRNGRAYMTLDPHHRVPGYVVQLCERLAIALVDRGHTGVTLEQLLRVERTCTGADYASKLAMRVDRL